MNQQRTKEILLAAKKSSIEGCETRKHMTHEEITEITHVMNKSLMNRSFNGCLRFIAKHGNNPR